MNSMILFTVSNYILCMKIIVHVTTKNDLCEGVCVCMYRCISVHEEIWGLQRSPQLTLAFETRSLEENGTH